MNYKQHTICRVCQSEKLTEYLDLGFLPLSNNLCHTPQEEPERYPLKVLFCNHCSLSQLSIVIDQEILFGHYVYRSSISQGYKDHCRKMAKDLKEKHNLTEDSFMIDIAGNDGALLNEFQQEIGLKTLNVDPASNLLSSNDSLHVRMFTTFWGMEAAKHLEATSWPKADLITATNVFAHVDNVKEFIEACKFAMKPTGVLVMEFPYLIDFIEKVEFDTIYHEHLSYFSIWPLVQLCNDCGITVLDVEKQDIHGGSVRVTIGQGYPLPSVNYFMHTESLEHYDKFEIYKEWALQVQITISNFRDKIHKLKRSGALIAGFAASAKGNTLLNCAGITESTITYIIDQTPEKVGKYSPGTHIPIVNIEVLNLHPPDYIVLLSWNFAEECMNKCRDAGYKGRFIMPLNFEIYETSVNAIHF